MSSKEQKTPEGQAPEEIIMDQHEEIEAVEPEASAEQVDPRDEKIANLEAQLAEAQTRERDGILRVKAEMENLRRRTELDIEKAHKFALEKFINELLPVIDSLDRALEVGAPALFLSAQEPLKGMYEKYGFEQIGDAYQEGQIPHVKMTVKADEVQFPGGCGGSCGGGCGGCAGCGGH